jgi:hypothetical protein
VTREERCSFPVGTDRPARRRPAALDRPVTPGPLLPGRLPPTVYSPDVRLDAFGRSLLHRELARTVCLARSVIAEEAVVSRRDTQIRRFEFYSISTCEKFHSKRLKFRLSLSFHSKGLLTDKLIFQATTILMVPPGLLWMSRRIIRRRHSTSVLARRVRVSPVKGK